MDSQKWLTVSDAAKYSKSSQTTIRKLIHAGLIRAVPGVSKGYLIDMSDVDAYLNRMKKVISPYRRGTRPAVAARWAARRKRGGR